MIRTANKNDIERIAQIWYKANVNAHDFIPSEYWTRQFKPVKEMLPFAELYVYEHENRITGFVGLDNNYIAGIFVSPDAQSGGIGKQLLDHVKSLKPELTLKVYQQNEGAVRFYQREDFVVQSEGIDDSTGEKEYLMTWQNYIR